MLWNVLSEIKMFLAAINHQFLMHWCYFDEERWKRKLVLMADESSDILETWYTNNTINTKKWKITSDCIISIILDRKRSARGNQGLNISWLVVYKIVLSTESLWCRTNNNSHFRVRDWLMICTVEICEICELVYLFISAAVVTCKDTVCS